jgi:tRNA (guanine37-N1)-methyltransferase
MKFTILTLFPEMFDGPFDSSIIKRAKMQGKISIDFINIRDFAIDKHKSVDDHPYGGGPGMILRVDVIDKALKKLKGKKVLLDPTGLKYAQSKAREYSKLEHLILVSGHYEGVDARIDELVDEKISIGDYVLTGGEIPAMVIVDSITRLLPGVLKKEEATQSESFTQDGVLEYPQYTRPKSYKGKKVPDILISGDHKKIAAWRASHRK